MLRGLLGGSFFTIPSCLSTLFRFVFSSFGLVYLQVHPLLRPEPILHQKERSQTPPSIAPRMLGASGNLAQNGVIIGRWTVDPVVHEEKKIGSVLLGGEPPGVLLVVAWIYRHENIGLALGTIVHSRPSSQSQSASLATGRAERKTASFSSSVPSIVRRSSTLRRACKTVVWSRFPNLRPRSGSDLGRVISRAR